MMIEKDSGFVEVEHTADWALQAWSPDFSGLLEQCARGMYWLVEMSLQPQPRETRHLELEGIDAESLLVTFLTELLYLGESENLGFDRFDLQVQGHRLTADISGAPIREQKKEIKAVTYHHLEVRHTAHGVSVTVVFDV